MNLSTVVVTHQTTEDHFGIAADIGSFVVAGDATDSLTIEDVTARRKCVSDDTEVDESLSFTAMVAGTEVCVEDNHVLHRAFHVGEHAWENHHLVIFTFNHFIELVGVVLETCDDITVTVEGTLIG